MVAAKKLIDPKNYKCDKLLDAGSRRCNGHAMLFYQSETIRQIAARCAKHEVVPFKPELGRLLTLSVEEYERERQKLDGDVLTPKEILKQAEYLMSRTGFAPHNCAVGRGGERLPEIVIDAVRFCVSGAARAVAFRGIDGEGSAQEAAYIAAMDAFCHFVGTTTVMEWADYPGRTTEEACAALRGAADTL